MHMKRFEGSWSGMRNYLEKEMLADVLKGRIRYCCTKYPNTEECGHFEIRVDGKFFMRFSLETVAKSSYTGGKPTDRQRFWKEMWETWNMPLNSKDAYTDDEFADALRLYRQNDIQTSICSENPITRMFALLDRRIGKRTLQKYKEAFLKDHDWLKTLYLLRAEAEKLEI